MFGVEKSQSQRVIEDRRGLSKRDTVFGKIADRLIGIPFEFHATSINQGGALGNLGTPSANNFVEGRGHV